MLTIRNRVPAGNHDSVSNGNCSTSGWVVDYDALSLSTNLHIYRDGPAGTGTLVGGYAANMPRSDVNQATGATGNHGFNIVFNQSTSAEAALFDGQPHTLYAYGIDTLNPASNNALLGNSPKTITRTPQTTAGDLNGNGVVNNDDVDVFKQVFGANGNPGFVKADINNTGVVDIFDFNLLIRAYMQ